jgi:hypothetical protein
MRSSAHNHGIISALATPFKAAYNPISPPPMVIIIATLLAVTAFVVLVRLLWVSASPDRYSTVITLAAATLVLGLAVLAATGRLHWLAAVIAAVVPFLRRGWKLVRYLPFLTSMMGSMRQQADPSSGGGQRRFHQNGSMDRTEALEVLGLGTQPTREDILAAHRRLIQKLHPDRGGSTYLAQQLNEAKRRLLEDL